MSSEGEMLAALAESCRIVFGGGYKVMTCGRDVKAVLEAATPERIAPTGGEISLAFFTGVDIVVDEDWEPGAWRIVQHRTDTCRVSEGSVTHVGCPVLSEGTL
jgi:hypothetical protein